MAARLARLLLALVLLAGVQLSLVHPLQHVDAEGGYVHLDDGRSPQGSGSGGLCDLMAALGACMPVFPAQLGPMACADEPFALRDPAAHLPAAAPPFLSQGPPVLL